MHVPDGFLNAPVSVAMGAVAVCAVAVALPKARRELGEDRSAPMVGIVASVVFAAQMLNFPVGAGTSGHLMGGALAAILVGPWAAVLVMTSVLLVQTLIFADGGITALGTNITVMGVVTVLVGWLLFRGLLRLLPRRRSSIVAAGSVAALLSVPVAAVVFSGLFLVGGQAPVDPAAVLAAMVGWHLLIGVGEAVITGSILSAVMAMRPDLVYGARFGGLPNKNDHRVEALA